MTDLLHLLWEASSRMDRDEIGLLRAYCWILSAPAQLRRLKLRRNLGLEDRYEVLRTAVKKCFIGLAPVGVLDDTGACGSGLTRSRTCWPTKERSAGDGQSVTDHVRRQSSLPERVAKHLPESDATTDAGIQDALENILVLNEDLA